MVPTSSLAEAGNSSRISPPSRPVAILTGTTASGKTSVALAFARRHPEIEIVNADSLLVYRGFDIGTAKPTREELAEIPHHLVDIREPEEPFTAGDFVRECDRALKDIHARGKRALIVGGTGFYLKALVYGLWEAPKCPPELRASLESDTNEALFARLLGLDESAAMRITVGDRYRLLRALETIETTGRTPTELEAEAVSRGSVRGLSLFVTDRENEELNLRIAIRTEEMIRQGLLEEVRILLNKHPGARPLGAVGYAETTAALEGRVPAGRKVAPGIEGLAQEIQLATRQLAKRQRTFFGNPTRGQFTRVSELKYFTLDQDREILEHALETLYENPA